MKRKIFAKIFPVFHTLGKILSGPKKTASRKKLFPEPKPCHMEIICNVS